MMEDLDSLECVVCSRLAQDAVMTPCCSSLSCRVCAITNIIKSMGKCGACNSSPVFLSSLVPQHQVRRRVEEVEVWKQVNRKEMVHCHKKRAFNDTCETNKIESKRMKLNKSDHSAEVVKDIQSVETKTETINSERSERANCGLAEINGSEVTKNSSSEITKIIGLEKEENEAKSAFEASTAEHRQQSVEVEIDADQNESRQVISCIEKELADANETLTIKEQELENLKIFIKHKNEELNNIKLTLAEENIKKMVEEKEVLFQSLTNERQNAKKFKEELAMLKLKEFARQNASKIKEEFEKKLEVLKNNNVQLKKICRNFREKLTLADEKCKRILDENDILNDTLKSVKEENKKIQEKQQLKNEQQNASKIKEELANKEKKLELKTDLESKHKLLIRTMNNNVQLEKIGRNVSIKLTSVEEQGKKSLEENTLLNATLKSVEEEKKKIQEENQQLKSSNKAIREKMVEKYEKYRNVLSNAKAKIQTELIQDQADNQATTTKMSENEERAMIVLTDAIVELEETDLGKKSTAPKSEVELQSQFNQKLGEAMEDKVKENDENREEMDENMSLCQIEESMLLNKTANIKNITKTDFKKQSASDKVSNSFSITPSASVTEPPASSSDQLISDWDKPVPEILVKLISDENHNAFSEEKTFPEMSAKATLDENRIQSADSSSKWRIIFMDCEKISDGDHAQFTQIGCYVYRVSNRRKSSLFLPMYPTKHREYLQMKQKSDLLGTLHMTWEKETGFQFRGPDGKKIRAVSESDGFEDFLNFLEMTEGEDNVLFLNSPKSILPLLFNKISPNLLQKYVAGICELSSFLSESLDDDHLVNLSHTDDIYLRVMGKSFEEITPTCAQTAMYMFKMVDKICADRGNRNLCFEPFISKYFKPTSHFIKKFANLGTSRNENAIGDTVSLEIETSFRPGFQETVEMCRVDLVDLTGPSEEFIKSNQKDLDSISNCVDENMSALLMRSSIYPAPERKLPSNVILPVPVPSRKTYSKNPIEETRSKNTVKQSCIKSSIEETRSKNIAKQSCSKIGMEGGCSKTHVEQSYTKDPLNLNATPLMLKCPLCRDLVAAAVLLPCCMISACGTCARNMLVRDDLTCKFCMKKLLGLDVLIPNLV